MPVELELSRRNRNREKSLNFALRLVNSLKDFEMVEIVDRSTNCDKHSPEFNYIYVPKEDYDSLFREVERSATISGKIFIQVEPLNQFLSQYKISHILFTSELCNYSL